ncbi:YcgL domain-containing protein [Catenovulum adriaticum]|uniref:YcgL domain-containing protein OLW01_05465 n=1 Tax=Catenovulum adriaticum TaxID=2984846 RepID=A0ABY7ANW2_9ALTE|nr:YcgL domain-containing protein [Catenovulum sp. TS8]WAJ71248.1 YcgL domain-containing protein [Catenovulum sp. TS8]
MLSYVYKSRLLEDTYLYITKRGDFENVPDALLEKFGKPEFVLVLNLAKRNSLAIANIDKVKAELSEKGFYLQLPPPKESLLEEHKAILTKQGKKVND